ncbi:hypothetical protein [Bradyrhizobium sp. BWA-3-5]|uniref:hypothetical protein n=1 Tax=Bradyrhizobium sp. BWA-3-5 TaxID=3080013 RepID=UPI00293E587C|nr:hypothetical protein [Bradyrhizobium sp. BWA-3-5]WOH64449.1 hypothetical protein RX331_28450 [Bradyrhizobium sp. BWA-3-5]
MKRKPTSIAADRRGDLLGVLLEDLPDVLLIDPRITGIVVGAAAGFAGGSAAAAGADGDGCDGVRRR